MVYDGRKLKRQIRVINHHKFDTVTEIASIVTIGIVKTVKRFFFTFPALNSTAMNKKIKYSISYPIINDFFKIFQLEGQGQSKIC